MTRKITVKKSKAAKLIKPKKPSKKTSSYSAKDIFVLKGLEPIRKRPGMYIGTTGSDGLHHLVYEVVDNSIDEAIGGFCDEITVTLLPGNKVQLTDNGRGIPVDKHKATGKSALETIMTTLHTGGKFGGTAYKVSGGLHGVGISVVCALSKYMRIEVCRDGDRYAQEYSKGKVKTKLQKLGSCRITGTKIIFDPDETIFETTEFNFNKILTHLRQQAYLTKGVKIIVSDLREKENLKSHTFYFEGGIVSFVKYLTRGRILRNKNVFYCSDEKEGVLVETALVYTREFEFLEESFANNIHTKEGGMHLTGFRTALTRTLNDYAKKNNLIKESDDNLSGQDVREGITVIVSVKLRNPQFEGQTKSKLGNPEARSATDSIVSQHLMDFLERNPQDGRSIIENCLISQKARNAAKAARETVLRKGALDGLSLPGKLADCSSKDPAKSEIFLVEGDSAGGCFFGDTKVALTDGRNLSFKELIKEDRENKKNYCYTIQKDGSIGIELIKRPRITKTKANVIKVVLDNGEEIVCTPDHLFMLRDGFYEKAEELTIEDSLMPLRRQISRVGKRITIEGYELVYDNKDQRWIFTHILADDYNIARKLYSVESGSHRHHIDFNKLNNNPDNVKRMEKEEHMGYHRKMVALSLHTEETKEKCRKIHQSEEYKEKISKIMSEPKMKRMLSDRAKKQWQNEDYKEYMKQKFLEFYASNEDYRKKNNELLNEVQKEYWSNPDHRKKQSERVKQYFNENPGKKEELSQIAKKQWEDKNLLKWRSKKTQKQWTPEFRIKRKKAYNKTYKEAALKLLRKIFEVNGKINEFQYREKRLKENNKNLLKYSTILERFFGNNENRLEEAVLNYNHKIKKIIKLKRKIDVYDIEVENTHNFALASGVFVHNSGKQARDRRFQAILPLRGKILNVERARLDKILTSKEIKSLIIAMGTSVGEDFKIEKTRYHKIIIMTDSDVDGRHITTLLLTLFYRYFKPLIEAGYLYVAQPPLYQIKSGKYSEYAYTEDQRLKVVAKIKKDNKEAKINIQRYKGLGEMNPDQLWETTMDPETRILLQVGIESNHKADKTFDTLMGKEVAPRKKFIQTHAKKVKNLDI